MAKFVITAKTIEELERRIHAEMRHRGVFSGCEQSTGKVHGSKGFLSRVEAGKVLWTPIFEDGRWVATGEYYSNFYVPSLP